MGMELIGPLSFLGLASCGLNAMDRRRENHWVLDPHGPSFFQNILAKVSKKTSPKELKGI
jgi:hypothetical protein